GSSGAASTAAAVSARRERHLTALRTVGDMDLLLPVRQTGGSNEVSGSSLDEQVRLAARAVLAGVDDDQAVGHRVVAEPEGDPAVGDVGVDGAGDVQRVPPGGGHRQRA